MSRILKTCRICLEYTVWMKSALTAVCLQPANRDVAGSEESTGPNFEDTNVEPDRLVTPDKTCQAVDSLRTRRRWPEGQATATN